MKIMVDCNEVLHLVEPINRLLSILKYDYVTRLDTTVLTVDASNYWLEGWIH